MELAPVYQGRAFDLCGGGGGRRRDTRVPTRVPTRRLLCKAACVFCSRLRDGVQLTFAGCCRYQAPGRQGPGVQGSRMTGELQINRDLQIDRGAPASPRPARATRTGSTHKKELTPLHLTPPSQAFFHLPPTVHLPSSSPSPTVAHQLPSSSTDTCHHSSPSVSYPHSFIHLTFSSPSSCARQSPASHPRTLDTPTVLSPHVARWRCAPACTRDAIHLPGT